MGFTCSICKVEKIKLPTDMMNKEDFVKNINRLYEECKFNYEDLSIEDWCSDGSVWFVGLKDILHNEGGDFSNIYVIDKNNYSKLVDYAITTMNRIQLEDYYVDRSLLYLDSNDIEDEDAYICRRIDGIVAHNDRGMEKKFWVSNEPTFMTTVDYVDGFEYYSIFRFIQAVLKLGTIDFDREIVWIEGGW